jgi:hypothetical protein
MTTQQDWRAIIYDAGIASASPGWESMAWNDTGGKFRTAKLDPEAESLAVAGRTIVASGSAGALAVFPAPHQFFYPQDEAYNLKFVWRGRNYSQRVGEYGFGIRQSDTGDKRFVPWFNAPPGTEQRLGVFYLLTRGDARQALAAVARASWRPLPKLKKLSRLRVIIIEHRRTFSISKSHSRPAACRAASKHPGS